MAKPIDEHRFRKYLAAFADGELDVEQTLQVLEHMAMNPQATRRVMHQQKLRQAVDRAVRSSAPPLPDGLRQQVQSLAETTPTTDTATDNQPSGRSLFMRINRWAPLAAAAVVLVTALVFLNVASQNPQSIVDNKLIPVNQIEMFARRHMDCGQMLSSMNQNVMPPNTLMELPDALKKYFGVQLAGLSLDLTALGYEYQGTGRCSVPGQSIHLVYRSTTTSDRPDTLSIWVRPYTGAPAIDPGTVYTVAGPVASFPVILWRRGDMVYYLVGDSFENAQYAAQTLNTRS